MGRWLVPWSVTRTGCSATCLDPERGSKAAEALALLALIAGQDVEPVEDSDGTNGRWRIAQQVATDRVIPTVDPDARHAHNSVHGRQDGFKAHVAIEPDTGIITDCALTKTGGLGVDGGTVSEADTGLDLLDGEAGSSVRVLADSAYGSGEFRAELIARGHVDLVKPAPTRSGGPGVGSLSMTSSSTTPTAPRPAPPQ